ncbi:MAG: hypothetical protein H7248_03020 [Microbacteriaceae bacterium]|nr:hypothetical protein [Microbacteriaceae bacterium]
MKWRRRWVMLPGNHDRVAPYSEQSRGSISAEFAVCLPAVVLMVGIALCAIQVATQQLRTQDAATVAARMIARGDGTAASATVMRLAPGASIVVQQRTNLVCVSVTSIVRITPGKMIWPTLHAESCAPKAAL